MHYDDLSFHASTRPIRNRCVSRANPQALPRYLGTMPVHIFVPRWMDQTNTNSQNLNAKALLSRFRDPRVRWTSVCSETPAEAIRQNGIETIRLSSTRWSQIRLALSY